MTTDTQSVKPIDVPRAVAIPHGSHELVREREAWRRNNWQCFDPSHSHRIFWPDRGYNTPLNPLNAARSTRREKEMSKVYLEPRPKSRDAHAPIDHFAVEDSADSVLYSNRTQQGAVDWAKRQGHRPVMVARVRHLPDKRNPDHWREV
jgi:hypothetical protein